MDERISAVPTQRISLTLKIWAGIIALFFIFGDRIMRLIFHCSFMNSLVIWLGALAILLLSGAAVAQVITKS
jgi:hypothetical protein